MESMNGWPRNLQVSGKEQVKRGHELLRVCKLIETTSSPYFPVFYRKTLLGVLLQFVSGTLLKEFIRSPVSIRFPVIVRVGAVPREAVKRGFVSCVCRAISCNCKWVRSLMRPLANYYRCRPLIGRDPQSSDFIGSSDFTAIKP